MILELDVDEPLPEGAVVVRAVAVIELLTAEGDQAVSVRHSMGMASWQAAGLAQAGADRWRTETTDNWWATDHTEDED